MRTLPIKRTGANDTLPTLLALLNDLYIFDTETAQNLRANIAWANALVPVLVSAPQVVVGGPVTLDPLLNPPRLINRGFALEDQFLPTNNDQQYSLGEFSGYLATICYFPGRQVGRRASFIWGCMEFRTEASMQAHYIDDVSQRSGEPRPQATMLMNFMRDVCVFHGWDDWFGDKRLRHTTRVSQVEPAPVPAKTYDRRPRDFLKSLVDTYDFGDALNGRIYILIDRIDEATDVLFAPPAFINGGQPLVPDERPDDVIRYNLGVIDDFGVLIRHDPRRAPDIRTRLIWGCANEYTQEGARRHWVNNISRQSGQRRPHATDLMNYVDAVCKQHGWTW